MTQTATRPETRVSLFAELNPEDRIVHVRDRWDGFTFASTLGMARTLVAEDADLSIVEEYYR